MGGYPRAATAEDLRRRTEGVGSNAAPAGSLEAALRALAADPDPAPIIVAGSLYLVGEARSLLLSGRLEDE